ncbi:unnamed protein product, partial [Arctogadus glacialis]
DPHGRPSGCPPSSPVRYRLLPRRSDCPAILLMDPSPRPAADEDSSPAGVVSGAPVLTAPSVEPRSPRRRQWSPGPHGAVSGAPVLTAPSVEPRSSRRRQWSPGPHGAVSGAPVLTAPNETGLWIVSGNAAGDVKPNGK